MRSLHFPLLEQPTDMNTKEMKDRSQSRCAYLNIDLVTAKDNGNVLADTLEIAMPVGHVLVRDTSSDIEHDDTTLALDIVPIAKSAKFFLTSRVPYVEADRAEVGRER